jgi:hypothetical protein
MPLRAYGMSMVVMGLWLGSIGCKSCALVRLPDPIGEEGEIVG